MYINIYTYPLSIHTYVCIHDELVFTCKHVFT